MLRGSHDLSDLTHRAAARSRGPEGPKIALLVSSGLAPRGRTTVWVLHTSVSKKASRAEICGGGSRKQSRSNLCNILVAVAVVAVYNEKNIGKQCYQHFNRYAPVGLNVPKKGE